MNDPPTALVGFGRVGTRKGLTHTLAVLFIYKKAKEALILSARDMAARERRQYGKK